MTPLHAATGDRASEIFASLQDRILRQTDRVFVILMVAQWAFAIAIALWLSPRSWEGAVSSVHPHVYVALLLGGLIAAPPIIAGTWWPGRTATRYVVAVTQMLMSALLIHVTGGRIETHFHIFGSLAFLAFYRDAAVLLPATVVVVLDHWLRGLYWPDSIYGVMTVSQWRVLEHTGWVLFEIVVLTFYCVRGRRELWRFARRTAEYESSNERYRAIVERAADAIVIFDADSRQILECNAEFARQCGHEPGALIARPVGTTMIGGASEAELAEELSAIMRAGRPTVSERTIQRADGAIVHVLCSLSPTPFDGHQAICAVMHDITRRKQMEAELASARDEAIRSERLKSQFLANMSHELRTPMNGIVGMSGFLLESPLDADQRMFAETIKSSADNLLTVVNDVLDFSRIESGRLELEAADFDVRQALEGSLDLLAEAAHAKGLALTLHVADDVPAGLRGDAGRLRQVVVNLVGNAVKFTERGEVAVDVTCAESRNGDVTLRVSVRDSGIGIEPAALARLFEAFVQADGSMTRRYGGTGLGLAISRLLVEKMSGQIGVLSSPGDGSTFWFTATFAHQSPSVAAPAPSAFQPADRGVPMTGDPDAGRRVPGLHVPAPGAAPAPIGARVLVAEDNVINQRVALLQLRRLGCRADAVANGAEVIGALERVPYDLVLMDCQMPEMDGFEATRRIRDSRAPYRDIPIVAMTANAMNGDRERCLAARMDDYVSKPVSMDELAATVRRWTRREAAQDDAAAIA